MPVCVAWMVHVPALTRVAIPPETVQTFAVVVPKVTARPEDAVAVSANGGLPNTRLGRELNVIVWLACVTMKFWLTIGAGIIWTFPRGVIVLKTLTSVLWNPSGGSNSVADVNVVVDE